MIVAAVDFGSNSTRLLIAEIIDGTIRRELTRRSTVTRLAEGVDSNGHFSDAAINRLLAEATTIQNEIAKHSPSRTVGVMTSAFRDAADGQQLATMIVDQYGIPAKIVDGVDEAKLTFVGATSARTHTETNELDSKQPALQSVIDIGGGSTETVCGTAAARPSEDPQISWAASQQLGVVRCSERHLHADPPSKSDLVRLRAEAVSEFSELCQDGRVHGQLTAVAGTATSCASIAQNLDLSGLSQGQIDAATARRIDGFVLTRDVVESIAERVATMPLDERRTLNGLHPDRAPTIIASTQLLAAAMQAFSAESVTVSDRDLLHGAALLAANGTGKL